jgi:homoserine kinase type II
MAVFTEVRVDQAQALASNLGLGQVKALQGIEGGIENTNYFLSTERGEWVLTLFERLTHAQLPFYLHLMKHLAEKGVRVPEPQAKQPGVRMGRGEDDLLHTVCGKPAAVVGRLPGKSVLAPTAAHCSVVGEALARMHLAGQDYDREQPNLRGLAWWNETVPVVLPHLSEPQRTLIESELAYQNHIADSAAYAALPRGPIHADLFRDNVIFETAAPGADDGEVRLGGFFDFYFAGCDTWLFDLAVCLNDWAIDWTTGAHDAGRAQAMLAAYETVRPLTGPERELLPAMLRAGALRFWVSRLWDFHLPREASMLKAHDPGHFERVLRERVAHPHTVR